MPKKKLKLENVVGKVRTSIYGPKGLYIVENGIIKPIKLEEQKEIILNTKELI